MEHLIEAVRQYPCLWNTKQKDYHNAEKKEMAWNNIIRLNLNIPEITDITTAKAEWKKLRDNHRDSLKRQKSKSTGEPTLFVNNWKYAKHMEFLIPYMKNRKKTSNSRNLESTEQSFAQQPTPAPMQFVCIVGNEQCTQKDNLYNEPTSSSSNTKKRKNDDEIGDIMRESETNYTRQLENPDIRRNQEKKDPIEIFFQSMAETTKAMPTFMQNRIKKKVLEVVCEAEEELESYNITSTYGYSTPSGASTSDQIKTEYSRSGDSSPTFEFKREQDK